VLGSTLVRDLTPIDRRVTDGPSDAEWADLDAPAPLIEEFRGGLADAGAAALEVLKAARDSKRALPIPPNLLQGVGEGRVGATSSGEGSDASAGDANLLQGVGGERVGATSSGGGTTGPSLKETVHHLSVADQPYWLDHAFYEQPAGWPVVDDLFPLVPMTAIIEMLQHAAEDLVPGTVATRVEGIRAFKWLTVHPPTAVTVRATRDGDGPDPATGETTVKTSIDKHARATVVVAPAYPAPPEPQATEVHGEIHCPCTPETLYEERHLFHGPAYQGLLTFDEFGTDGASGLLETKDFPGSLLDNAGQLFGFWLAQRVDKDRLVLPTSIDRIGFYGPHPAEGTVVRCVVNATEIGEVVVRADLELTVDGVVWCRIEGWEDRRFQSDDRLFTLLRKPHDRTLAEPQDGGWVLVTEGWPDSASRDVVMRRFLGIDERSDYDARNPNVQRTWLLGRIAAKDAVRDLLWRTGTEGRIFPVEVTVANDADGAPRVTAPDGSDVRVSIAHTAGLGVAIAARGVPVGIDIERIEDRPDSFELAALSKKERARFEALPDIDRQSVRDVELTRWWAAKEAAAKAAGTGMQGRPKDWKIVEIDGDRLRIGDRWLGTTRLGADHVVAWTEIDEPPARREREG
jgi:phosphopantetheinyl transferase (holo-ACP synthase)